MLLNEKDLKAARLLRATSRSELEKAFSQSELEKAFGSEHEKIFRTKFQELTQELTQDHFPAIDKLKQSLKGACYATVMRGAFKRLNGKSWSQIATSIKEGVGKKAAGAQSFYSDAVKKNKRAKELASSFFKIQLHDVQGVSKVNSDEDNLTALTQLSDGIYYVSLKTVGGTHAILYSREGDIVHILDPNIGLLCCKHDQAKALLAKVVKDYRIRPGEKSHELQAKKCLLEKGGNFWERLRTKHFGFLAFKSAFKSAAAGA